MNLNTEQAKLQILLQSVNEGSLVTGVLSSPWNKGGYHKVSIRPILIKGLKMYQLTEHFPQKVLHRNLSPEICSKFIHEALSDQFRQGIFATLSSTFHVLVNKQKQMTIITKEVESKAVLSLEHNRSKNYLFPDGKPVDFLIELGIMTGDGQVIAKKYDKFCQINRFVELVDDVIEHLPKDRPIHVVDFGCGNAYLTFALYYYLLHIAKRHVKMLGIDLKQDSIKQCQELTVKLGYEHLSFILGDINHHPIKDKIDLVISLHACDTATDALLEKAVLLGADVILSAPCCQHELYNQVKSESLATLLRHGLLRERFAALATDAARAELLTATGYEVQIMEFIDMEHTPKNILIRAVKGISKAKQKHAMERYALFKKALEITPSIETRLGNKNTLKS